MRRYDGFRVEDVQLQAIDTRSRNVTVQKKEGSEETLRNIYKRGVSCASRTR